MRSRSSNRAHDANELAKRIVDIATGEAVDLNKEQTPKSKNPAAV